MFKKALTAPAFCAAIAALGCMPASAAELVAYYVPGYYVPAYGTPWNTYPYAPARYIRAYDIQGVVTAFGGFNMTLRIDGRYVPVQLHQGTIINPTGLSLRPGMLVNVHGFWNGNTFFANRIVLR